MKKIAFSNWNRPSSSRSEPLEAITPERSSACLLWVRDESELERVLSDVSNLLDFQRRRQGSSSKRRILGVWIENDSQAFERFVSKADVGQIVGLAGVWNLAELDGTHTRLEVLERLFVEGGAARGRFVPVFANDEPVERIQATRRVLEERFGGRVSTDLRQHGEGGPLRDARAC